MNVRIRGVGRLGTAALATVVVACQGFGLETGPTVVRGSIYTDIRGSAQCTGQPAPRELSGIGLRFVDASGRALGSAVTGPAETVELAPGTGDGGEAGACRYRAPYEVALPTVPAYTVEFDVPDPPERGGYFSGTDELKTQTLSREALAEQGYDWSFEVPASYVVP